MSDNTGEKKTFIDTYIDKDLEIVKENNKTEIEKRKIIIQEKLIDNVFSNKLYVFIICILVAISGIIVALMIPEIKDKIEYWKLISPLIATYIGYAIGNSKNKV